MIEKDDPMGTLWFSRNTERIKAICKREGFSPESFVAYIAAETLGEEKARAAGYDIDRPEVVEIRTRSAVLQLGGIDSGRKARSA